MAHKEFDEQMAALDALKGQPLNESGVALVKKALASRSNFLAAKAAKLAEENERRDLSPELLSAYERFFANPEKADPQCWAKNALSHALAKLECRDKEVFLRGLRHQQWEPVWGGKSDSAGTLRGNCAHALVGCDGLIAQDLIVLLVDVLADHDKAVRVEAVRALAQLGDLAVPVLRLRALISGEDAEVLAACYSALLAIEREDAIAFVARFLAKGDDAAAEAAFALAEMRTPAALRELIAVREHSPAEAEPWFAQTLLSAIALTRLPEAANYLLHIIEAESRDAVHAIEALAKAGLNEAVRERLVQAVQEVGSPRLLKALREHLSE